MNSLRRPFSGGAPAVLAVAWVAAHALLVHGWRLGSFVALVPFSLGIMGAARNRGALAFAFLGGWGFFLVAEYFLGYFSWTGLAVFACWQAATLVPVALALRWLRRRWGLPLAFSLPVVWVGGEFLRNLGPLAIPTGMLMGPCYDQLWMIQVCDLAGVYGLNCALAMVNGLIADVFLFWWHGTPPKLDAKRGCGALPANGGCPLPRPFGRGEGRGEGAVVRGKTFGAGSLRAVFQNRALRISCLCVLAGWLFIPAYGAFRLAEARRTMRPGPRLAVVQSDIPFRSGIANGFDPDAFLDEMLERSARTLTNGPPPELIVWPEAMGPMPPLNAEFRGSTAPLPPWLAEKRDAGRAAAARLHEWITRQNTRLLLGTVAWMPPETNPAPWRVYNSAAFLTADRREPEPRQFKMRLFPGGEQIPWRGTVVHRVLVWLMSLSGQFDPFAELEPGPGREVFTSPRDGSRSAVNICYEILFPDSSGVFLSGPDGGKPFDYLINLSNDGIFQRSHGQLVHWRNLPFRAVEGRIGIARAANTGISGFVKPTGEIYGQVENRNGEIWTGRGAPELPLIADVVKRREHEEQILRNPDEYRRLTNDIARITSMRAEAGVSGQSVQNVFTDTRRTLYSRTGDVLPVGLLMLTLFCALGGLAPRVDFVTVFRRQS